MQPTDGIRCVKGIGEKTEKAFKRLGIVHVGQLLSHYPKRYEVYGPIQPIREVREGQTVSIEARLMARPRLKQVRGLKIVTADVRDGTGIICIKWFNMAFLVHRLRLGEPYIFRGKVVFQYGTLVMGQPQILTKQEFHKKQNAMQPVYSLTEGLTNHMTAKAVNQAIKDMEWEQDHLPSALRKKYRFMEYKRAIQCIHFPKNEKEAMDARNRLAFDEFFFFLLAFNRFKRQKIEKESSIIFKKSKQCQTLLTNLPYELTNAQKRVWSEIEEDLTGGKALNRLIQGDVGSGKTVIAALALLTAVENSYQGAIMVPTEVLARQHAKTLKEWLGGFGIRLELLTGSMTMAQKRKALDGIASGEAQVIVGTHALIQEKCEYDRLGLVITDEQHRFGVRQREALFQKGKDCHVLVMSATPIPRSLAVILYGDMDISVIDELPSNRLPVKSCLIPTRMRNQAYRFLQKEVKQGRQAYVICPMVEGNENLELENVMEYADQLKNALPTEVNVGYLHGRMKSKEKNEIMERFINNQIQVLVSTTVIEVGINVPNATVIMVENAERFGLAGLHQLRGRVGRGEWQSYAIFVSGTEDGEAMQRLEVLTKSNDGFFIASEDLRLRGPGDLFGVRQSGMMEFRLADVFGDANLLKAASDEVKNLSEKEALHILKKKTVFSNETRLDGNGIPL